MQWKVVQAVCVAGPAALPCETGVYAGAEHYILSPTCASSVEGCSMNDSTIAPSAASGRANLGHRAQTAIALLLTWALVMSVAFAWLWAADQQDLNAQRTALDAAINKDVSNIGRWYLSAGGTTQDMLRSRDIRSGLFALVWLDAVVDQLQSFDAIPDSYPVLAALNLSGGAHCAAYWYYGVLYGFGLNTTFLNGTNQFTRYFWTASNLTQSLASDILQISENGNNSFDQLNSPAAAAIRDESAQLATLSPYGQACP
jgi:hypothetical protein